MLTIRLYRAGKKGQPFYKIVVTDKRNAAHRGRFIEEVGVVNPIKKDKAFKAERIKHWLKMGAKPSVTVFNMLLAGGVIEGNKIVNHAKSKKKEEAKPAAPTASVASVAPVAAPVEKQEKLAKETPVAEEPKSDSVNEPEKTVIEEASEVKAESKEEASEIKTEEPTMKEETPEKPKE